MRTLPDESATAGLRVGLGVRPPRVAIGIPSVRGISWLRLFEVAIAAQTRTWGGLGNLVFPLADRSPDSELFWALADRFDADAWGSYSVRPVADELGHEAAHQSLLPPFGFVGLPCPVDERPLREVLLHRHLLDWFRSERVDPRPIRARRGAVERPEPEHNDAADCPSLVSGASAV